MFPSANKVAHHMQFSSRIHYHIECCCNSKSDSSLPIRETMQRPLNYLTKTSFTISTTAALNAIRINTFCTTLEPCNYVWAKVKCALVHILHRESISYVMYQAVYGLIKFFNCDQNASLRTLCGQLQEFQFSGG